MKAILLARAGSKRLPNKTLLPWQGTTLLGWAVRQTLLTPSVDTLYVGSDSEEYLAAAESEWGELRELLKPKQFYTVRRKPVDDLQSSCEGVREVFIHAKDFKPRASIPNESVLLVQLTSPFVNPADLETLCRASKGQVVWANPRISLFALTATPQGERCKPSGMGYVFNPVDRWPAIEEWGFIPQNADGCDIDTLDDYKAALAKMPIQPVYGR